MFMAMGTLGNWRCEMVMGLDLDQSEIWPGITLSNSITTDNGATPRSDKFKSLLKGPATDTDSGKWSYGVPATPFLH